MGPLFINKIGDVPLATIPYVSRITKTNLTDINKVKSEFEKVKNELDSGVVLTFPFNPRADYEVETGVLVGNENGYFALIGQRNQYEFVGLASVVSVAEEANSDTSDDLDFEMF